MHSQGIDHLFTHGLYSCLMSCQVPLPNLPAAPPHFPSPATGFGSSAFTSQVRADTDSVRQECLPFNTSLSVGTWAPCASQPWSQEHRPIWQPSSHQIEVRAATHSACSFSTGSSCPSYPRRIALMIGDANVRPTCASEVDTSYIATAVDPSCSCPDCYGCLCAQPLFHPRSAPPHLPDTSRGLHERHPPMVRGWAREHHYVIMLPSGLFHHILQLAIRSACTGRGADPDARHRLRHNSTRRRGYGDSAARDRHRDECVRGTDTYEA